MMRQKTHWPMLIGLLLATVPAVAQGPGGGGFGGPPPPGQGGPGQGGPGQGGGQRPPVAFGTVSAVDAAGGTLTLSSQNGGDPQVVKVGADATVVTLSTISVGDLKVGDQITVQGVPTGITASQVTDGAPPAGLPGAGGRFGGPGGGPGGPGGGPGTPGGAAPGFASAGGTVKSLPTKSDPHLVIALSGDTSLYVKMADDAKVSRYTTLTLADIKNGDRVVATGTTGDDGTLTATSVGVNLPGGGFGRFGGGGYGGGYGRGGRRGFGGGGGQGFGGPPPGGPGGPPPPGQ